MTGDLTAGAAAALAAVLDALGKKAGPEDTRTTGQRRHDALQEACTRLIAAGMVPGRAGQPARIQLHMTLDQLRRRDSTGDRDSTGSGGSQGAGGGHDSQGSRGDPWAAARGSEPGWLSGPEADAAACDATIVPLVTGHVDPAALDKLTDRFLTDQPPYPLSPLTRRRLRGALLGLAADALSGPGGLPARLRAGLGWPLGSPSLPLDIGAATDTIPAHLRAAARLRHPCCGFPGCSQPAEACQIHHIVPRASGGPTALSNLLPLCGFHHLIVIHRWGWAITLNPDATTTATSPDGRVFHSHDPPARAA